MGVADDASPTGVLDLHGRALEAAMVREALADAGLTIDDVDGVCYGGMPPGIAEYLGIHPRFVDGTMTGGSSYELHVEHAAAAIAAGLCDVVVGVYAATPRGDRARAGGGGRSGPMPGPNPMLEWEMPYGLRMPMGAYALAASRHMAGLRHDVGAARADRGRHAPVGGAEPARRATAIRSRSTTCSRRRCRRRRCTCSTAAS